MRTPQQAIQWAMQQRTWPRDSCLNFWYNAYYAGEQTPLGRAGIPLPTAKAAWNASQFKVTDGSLPPIGGLMYFDGVPGDLAGDVQARTGETMTWRTDVGTAGHLGSVPIMWMRDALHHPYLGWTRDVLGTLVFPAGTAAASSGDASPVPAPNSDPFGGVIMEKGTLFRNNEPTLNGKPNPNYGSVDLCSPLVGFRWHLPTTAYIPLLVQLGLIDSPEPINLPDNDWQFVALQLPSIAK